MINKTDPMMSSLSLNLPTRDLPNFQSKQKEDLKEAAKQFESLFMNMVMKGMRETVPDGGLLEGSDKVKFFQGMLDEEYSKLSSEQGGGRGLADIIYQNLLQQMNLEDQEVVKDEN